MAKRTLVGEGAFTSDLKKKINDNFSEVYGLQTVMPSDQEFSEVTITTNLTGLDVNLGVGTYLIDINLVVSSTANGGAKTAFNHSNGLVLGMTRTTGTSYTSSGSAATESASISTGATRSASTAAVTYITVKGVMTVTTAGRMRLMGAQNASSTDVTTFLAGSSMVLKKLTA